jgi:hypothetical protein
LRIDKFKEERKMWFSIAELKAVYELMNIQPGDLNMEAEVTNLYY